MEYESSKFTKRITSSTDKAECESSVVYEQTNPRFDNFDQIIFHAGDRYDIERYGLIDAREIDVDTPPAPLPHPRFHVQMPLEHPLCFRHVLRTLKYQYHGFKKGILVVIRDNKLVVFLPFSNPHHSFEDLVSYLFFDETDKELLAKYQQHPSEELYAKIEERFQRLFCSKNTESDRRKWGINNCFFRDNRLKTYEGEHSITELEYIFRLLVEKRRVPDIILFLHIRDFPIFRKGYLHPFTHLVPAGHQVRKVFRKEKYPILSFCGGKDFYDIPIPTGEDIQRVSGRYFSSGCRNGYRDMGDINLEWEKKVEKGFFRGSLTGCGTTKDDNWRLKIHHMSLAHPDLLDAQISQHNTRIRKAGPGIPIRRPDVKGLRFGDFKSNVDKSFFKYIINLDGHSRAYRLGSEFAFNSVVLLQDSPYTLWFEHLLRPYEHYVPIQRDLSDLLEKIRWCREHDDECKKIAQNGRRFYETYLGEEGMLDYLLEVVHTIRRRYAPRFFRMPSPFRIALITVYRDDPPLHTRRTQKEFFLRHMPRLLPALDIYVVEQSEEHKFNIGALKNIGFLEMRKRNKSYDIVLFADIDLLPDYHLAKLCCTSTDGCITLAASGTRYVNINGIFAGGFLNVNAARFDQANGYPNNYYGWGGEDNALVIRLSINNCPFYVPKRGMVIDIEHDLQSRTKDAKTKLADMTDENPFRWEQIVQEPEIWRQDGLNTTEYTTLGSDDLGPNVYHYLVRLPGPRAHEHSGTVTKQMYLHTLRRYTSLEKNNVTKI